MGSRLTALVACMFVVSLTSGNYAFSVYSGALKHTLKLTQSDLDTLGTYPYIAGLFTWIPGIINDRYGARVATVLGCLGMAASLAIYWAVAIGLGRIVALYNAHPLHARFTNIFGASISEATMRPIPR